MDQKIELFDESLKSKVVECSCSYCVVRECIICGSKRCENIQESWGLDSSTLRNSYVCTECKEAVSFIKTKLREASNDKI